jgi:MFS family permease
MRLHSPQQGAFGVKLSSVLGAKRPIGMTAFIVVWLGQLVSVLASSMSHFGLTIWMFQETKSALAMGLMQVAFILPFLLLSPIAGVMVDRYNRKLMMMVSDFTAILATGSVFVLLALGTAGVLASVRGGCAERHRQHLSMAGLLGCHQHHGAQGAIQPR